MNKKKLSFIIIMFATILIKVSAESTLIPWIWSVAYSSYGKMLASVSADGTIKI